MLKSTEIGIDLGEKEIKITYVKEIGNKAEVNQLKKYKSYIVDCKQYSKEYFDLVRESIKDFSKHIDRKRVSLNFTLPYNEHTSILFMNVPAVSKKDLNLGVKFEADQLLVDRKLKDYKSTWKINNKYDELNEYEIMYATLETDIIKSLSKFKTINWKVNSIMLQPIALEKVARGNSVIIDYGYNKSRVYMYKEGILSEIHMIEIGSHTVEKEIEEYLKLNDVTVEESPRELLPTLYVNNDFIEFDGIIEDKLVANLSDVIEPTILKLIEETKRNIRTFELKNGLDMDNIYYTGGLFNLTYLNNKLESELDFDLTKLTTVSRDFDDNKYDIASVSSVYKKEKDRMDFIQHSTANVDYNSLLVGALTVSLTAGIALGILNEKYDAIISEQQTTQAEQNSTLRTVDENFMLAQESISSKQAFIDKINKLNQDPTWLSDALYILPDAIPLSVVAKDLQIVNGAIEITGYSSDYSSIGFFAQKLENYGEVEIVSIDDMESDGKIVYSVVTDTPTNISDKYKITKNFKIVLKHSQNLVER